MNVPMEGTTATPSTGRAFTLDLEPSAASATTDSTEMEYHAPVSCSFPPFILVYFRKRISSILSCSFFLFFFLLFFLIILIFVTIAINYCSGGNNCSANAACTYTGPGTFSCACNTGYNGTGTACTCRSLFTNSSP